jgi:beta-ribofuranosylaminobenzene 5'-phosphate synthase
MTSSHRTPLPMTTAALDLSPRIVPGVRTLCVSAPGRLHLGFLDPSATLGRAFGSLGLVIDGFTTELELSAAEADVLVADTPAGTAELGRLAAHLAVLRQRSGCHAPLSLRLRRALPAHVGLGSGTQIATAIGRAFAQWHGLEVDTATLAHWLGRGLRSGVGIAGFDHGGLLLDGGPGRDGLPAPLLSRIAFPEDWRIIVVQDPAHQGLSGSAERNAIAALAPFPQAAAAEICHQVLMRVLPGAARADFAAFAAGIGRMQRLLGEHFASAQGGLYTSPAVDRLMHAFDDAGRRHEAALGQSSWGPAAFAIVPSQGRAELLVEAARAAGHCDPRLEVRIVAGRNAGASVRERRAVAPRP